MEYVLEFLKEWGYLAVLLGSMVEGETIILAACALAYNEDLSISKVAGIAFLGTLVADQGLYYVGRFYGHQIIRRFPKLKIPSEKAFHLLHKWDIGYILSFRFIFGIRIISPIVIGTAGVAPKLFIPLNFLAAIIWTSLSCSVGYYIIGPIFAAIDLAVIKKYTHFISIGLLVIVIYIAYSSWKKLNHNEPEPPHS
ncbi:DedA family protein [Candidatus Odyssella thessalonicensis]|uniref:DedA family protein n=1 Tax=Candidatus Odyssella thessalonicensis TaxID=84647 RepID=UPI000225A8EA|nr:DedA family protein [Candidatus Odyssella thessalonicensis]